jgi:hypothetical protein
MEKVLDKDINPITEKILEDCEKGFFKVYSTALNIIEFKGDEKKIIANTQMSNILRNIKNISCIKEIELFIKYQEARENNKNKGWALKSRKDNKTLAESLIEQIKSAEKIAGEYLKNNIENTFNNEEFKIKAVEKLMGYCYWHVYHTYNKKTYKLPKRYNRNNKDNFKKDNKRANNH